jgi:hypothetical protein
VNHGNAFSTPVPAGQFVQYGDWQVANRRLPFCKAPENCQIGFCAKIEVAVINQ